MGTMTATMMRLSTTALLLILRQQPHTQTMRYPWKSIYPPVIFFGIEPVITTEDELTHANDQLKHQKQLHDADVRIAHLEGSMEQMTKTIEYQRKKSRDTKFAIYGLTFLCAMFMAVIVGYIFFDYRVPNLGLIQGGQAGVFAWIVFLLLAAGIGIFASVFVMYLRYAKKHTPNLDV